jgi:N-acylneuraminate cytidylyltransferase/CMP-N,N'-diacetyllegionaminic acid synthase
MARGGSKGVPGKNIREIGGLPLLAFKARAAQRSKYPSRLIISTDSLEIQEVARAFGVEVPFTRPADLATDAATNFAVLHHAMRYFESQGQTFDAIFMLEPSSPFTLPGDLDKAVDIMQTNSASLVVSMRDVDNPAPFVGPIESDGRITRIVDQLKNLTNVNRQVLPHAYTLNGVVYLFRWDALKNRHTFYSDPERSYGFETDPVLNIEIDSELDLAWAQFLVEKQHISLEPWL